MSGIKPDIAQKQSKLKNKNQSFIAFNLRLFPTTETELKAIAAPAIIGSSKNPLKGYSKPAATGIPIKL